MKTAEFLNSLSQREIDEMARTYTEGYRIGFITGRKDISKKKTVNIRYQLGFERMVKSAVLQFEEMGLKTVIYRHALHAVNRRNQFRNGFTGGIANPQFDYDHRQDSALFMDSDFVNANFAPCRLPMMSLLIWQQFMEDRHASRHLEKHRFHR